MVIQETLKKNVSYYTKAIVSSPVRCHNCDLYDSADNEYIIEILSTEPVELVEEYILRIFMAPNTEMVRLSADDSNIWLERYNDIIEYSYERYFTELTKEDFTEINNYIQVGSALDFISYSSCECDDPDHYTGYLDVVLCNNFSKEHSKVFKDNDTDTIFVTYKDSLTVSIKPVHRESEDDFEIRTQGTVEYLNNYLIARPHEFN